MYCVAKDLKNPEIGFEDSMNGNPKKQRAKILGSTVVVGENGQRTVQSKQFS